MTARVLHGDCREVLRTLADASVDAVVTDPPAGIAFMGKEWDRDKGGRDEWIAWMRDIAAECLRVVKPGAHALVWALPRTSHWTATAWENAGWEVRDRMAHLFGTGFPKSLDVSKAIDKAAGAEREVVGLNPNARPSDGKQFNAHGVKGHDPYLTAPAPEAARQWQGWGTALKPACEDWWLLRKPLAEPTVAANVLAHGCGAINVDACRVPTLEQTARTQRGTTKAWEGGAFSGDRVNGGSELGRFPANVTHDGSDEVMEAFAAFGERRVSEQRGERGTGGIWGTSSGKPCGPQYGDTGTAARFFYCAKASARDRAGSKHPTVKNLALMRWLCRLITPPGGTILDPFAGSGTTLQAAIEEGFRAIGIEQEAEYHADILRRMDMMRPVQPSLLAT